MKPYMNSKGTTDAEIVFERVLNAPWKLSEEWPLLLAATAVACLKGLGIFIVLVILLNCRKAGLL